MYKIMHKTEVIALADEENITEIINKALCPHCFVVGMPLYIWLDNRCVDMHRSHSRRLFKALRLRNSENTAELISIGHGVSITDNWWIQRDDENLEYRELKKYNEQIADIALLGGSDSDERNTEGYLELGTVGSYEKAWRFEGNSWYMYKQGGTQELVSEYYSYLFLKAMQFYVAEYRIKIIKSAETGLSTTFMLSKDFTNNAEVDFEPFCNYFGDNEELDFIIPKLPEKLIKQYVMTVFYDALLFNGDRHNQNIGIIRDSLTGEILSLAPGFDYNLGLIASGVPRINKRTGNVFTKSLLSNETCRRVLKENIPDRQKITIAVEFATAGVKSALGLNDLNYSLIENYIKDTFDYISENIY